MHVYARFRLAAWLFSCWFSLLHFLSNAKISRSGVEKVQCCGFYVLDKPLFSMSFIFGCVCVFCLFCFKVNVNICGRITSEMFSFTFTFSPLDLTFLQAVFFCKFSSLKLFPIVFFFHHVCYWFWSSSLKFYIWHPWFLACSLFLQHFLARLLRSLFSLFVQ